MNKQECNKAHADRQQRYHYFKILLCVTSYTMLITTATMHIATLLQCNVHCNAMKISRDPVRVACGTWMGYPI